MSKQLYSFITILILTLSASSFAITTNHNQNINLTPTSFTELPSWNQTKLITSFKAFKQSCTKILSLKPDANVGTPTLPLTVADWQSVCQAAIKLKTPSNKQTRQFFETHFKPYAISNKQGFEGLFTGYYLPAVKGRLQHSKQFNVPIYGRPNNLITTKLGWFDTEFQGRKLAGRVINGRLHPYDITRKQINQGAIKNKAKVLAWVQYRADRALLQIQGSGVVLLPNHKQLVLGYDGDNGESYYPIGRWLLHRKIFTKENISMPKIYQWLLAHPVQAKTLLNKDKSFVFFTVLPNSKPLGTQSVPLTAGYSLAVDGNIIPLSSPLWLSTQTPSVKHPNKTQTFQRLMIAQDTGGAIKGAVRGDIYFGEGKQAAIRAGHMKHQGRYWVLLPN